MLTIADADLTLPAAAKLIPSRTGSRGVNAATLWRWAMKGCRGIKLETLLIGGIRYTSRTALDAFFAATTAAADGRTESVPSPDQQQRVEAAEQDWSEIEKGGRTRGKRRRELAASGA